MTASERPRETLDIAAVTAVAALEDNLRRRLYTYVREARRPVARDEAAEAAGISRKLAAFHLDKLVRTGLLTFGYDTVGGVARVGRKPKLYRPADTEIQVGIPARRHEILADILADAVLADSGDETARAAAMRIAAEHGERAGSLERDLARPGRLGTERALTLAEAVLTRYGFEPSRPAPDRVQLRNCPFQPLAAKAPGLVCGINHAFLTGVLSGLGAHTVEAALAPGAGCCVELRPVDGKQHH
ncbi:helix-turn-helix transcriptional regulator [Amycolatopsis sp. NPDC059027]|uniref:helix-turn-helix transcriptional regulator n=1 Tax=unclassified Amycolatopsis TaxID=2618356 RepID=UPI00366AAEE5